MLAIFKYAIPLELDKVHKVLMFKNACILYVDQQRDTPTFWAAIDTDESTGIRYFQIVGTGHKLPEGGSYIGSTSTHGGNYVWHIYEVEGDK